MICLCLLRLRIIMNLWSSVVPLEPFKNKVSKPRHHKTQARGACQEGQPRPRQEDLAGKRQGPSKRSLPGRPTTALQETCRDAPRVPARPGERQASERDKTTTAARRLPRQATTLYPRSSTSTNMSPWDLSRRAWREAVQPAVRGGKRR